MDLDPIYDFAVANGSPVRGVLRQVGTEICQPVTYEEYLELTIQTHECNIRMLKSNPAIRCHFIQQYGKLSEFIKDVQNNKIRIDVLINELTGFPKYLVRPCDNCRSLLLPNRNPPNCRNGITLTPLMDYFRIHLNYQFNKLGFKREIADENFRQIIEQLNKSQ